MPKNSLDAFSRRMLDVLQRDGRISNVELAEATGQSASPCLRRLRRLEEEGTVRGYTARLDRRRVGLGFTVFASVNLDRHGETEAAEFRRAVQALDPVIACHIVSGDSDFLLEIAVPDPEAYSRLVMETLLRLPGVKDLRSSFVIDTVKEGTALPLDHLGKA